jgi:antitoxin (DNA-binding transcriptional repressor) of toxin-antitoxin stability system
MRTVTASDASHHFSGLLDAVAQGESFAITRSGCVIAEIRPTRPSFTVGDLRRALVGVPPLDGDIERDIASATSMLTQDGFRWPDT